MRQLIEAIRTRDFSLQYSLDHLRGEERNLAEQINEVVNEFRETTLQQAVIQKNETDAQQQLVRVLTHEIMNSLTPIISLADTLCEGVEQDTLEHDDLLMALQAINRRSNGLLQFVENYRKLQRISKPQFEDVRIGDLVADLQHLYPDSIFHYEIENFIISITDNGKGILPEVMERIFVPFFTTKTSGSGIGLSICKQIVTLHGGTITASSKPGDKTTFSVVLPA